mmetsp:Transcript_10539/g.27241  ORF Transcript_10539/g.27241 Transcript_10539/m.27241 type:complete len:204 (+) Transcript_10539:1157-1768(+)
MMPLAREAHRDNTRGYIREIQVEALPLIAVTLVSHVPSEPSANALLPPRRALQPRRRGWPIAPPARLKNLQAAQPVVACHRRASRHAALPQPPLARLASKDLRGSEGLCALPRANGPHGVRPLPVAPCRRRRAIPLAAALAPRAAPLPLAGSEPRVERVRARRRHLGLPCWLEGEHLINLGGVRVHRYTSTWTGHALVRAEVP